MVRVRDPAGAERRVVECVFNVYLMCMDITSWVPLIPHRPIKRRIRPRPASAQLRLAGLRLSGRHRPTRSPSSFSSPVVWSVLHSDSCPSSVRYRFIPILLLSPVASFRFASLVFAPVHR